MINSKSQKAIPHAPTKYNLSLPVSERRLVLLLGDIFLLTLMVLLAFFVQSLLS